MDKGSWFGRRCVSWLVMLLLAFSLLPSLPLQAAGGKIDSNTEYEFYDDNGVRYYYVADENGEGVDIFFIVGIDENRASTQPLSGDVEIPAEIEDEPVVGLLGWEARALREGIISEGQKRGEFTYLEKEQKPRYSYSIRNLFGDVVVNSQNEKRVPIDKVTIPASVTKVDVFAFGYSDIKEVTMLGNVEEEAAKGIEKIILGRAFQNCQYLKKVSIQGNVVQFGSIEQDEKYPAAARAYTFVNCFALESIEFPAGLRRMGYGTFGNCTSLKEVRLPDSLEFMGGSIFRDCTSLERVVIPEKVKNLDGNFSNNPNLRQIIYLGYGDEKISADSETTIINPNMFSGGQEVFNKYTWEKTGDGNPLDWSEDSSDKEKFYIISKGKNPLVEASASSGNNPKPDTPTEPTEPTKPTESPTTPPPSGDITNAFEEPKKTIRIDKVDGQGKALAGARLLIKDSKGELVSQWTTVAGESQSLSLEAGSYILQEVEAPQGYHKVDDVLFSVDKEGKLGLVGSMLSVRQAKVEGNLLTVIDEAEVVKHPVTISKVDVRGKPLAEAMLTLKNAEGVVVQAWRSDANQSQLLQLSEGSYTLEETNAPKGYKKITALSFHVAQDGTVTLQKDTDTAYKTRIEGNRLIVTDEEESTVAATKTAEKPSATKSVKTGDDSAVLLWLMMALVAGSVVVGFQRQRRD